MEIPITHQLESDQENYEIRVAHATVDESNTIFGLIPYNTLSQDLGGFRERILPSAFQMTLDSGSEVWSMFQHDHNKVMARRSTETLKLTERDDGLQIEISPSNTTWSQDAGKVDVNTIKTAAEFVTSYGEIEAALEAIEGVGEFITKCGSDTMRSCSKT